MESVPPGGTIKGEISDGSGTKMKLQYTNHGTAIDNGPSTNTSARKALPPSTKKV